MASLQDINTIATDSVFRGRCLEALEAAAVNVMAEDGNTLGHLQRTIYANSVFSGSVNTYALALAVLANSTISAEATVQSLPGATSSVPDGDIQFTVNSIFAALAGVPANAAPVSQ